MAGGRKEDVVVVLRTARWSADRARGDFVGEMRGWGCCCCVVTLEREREREKTLMVRQTDGNLLL